MVSVCCESSWRCFNEFCPIGLRIHTLFPSACSWVKSARFCPLVLVKSNCSILLLLSALSSSELEQYVVSLQKESAAAHKAVTLRDVEEGAVTLRKVGESLAGLKGKNSGKMG